MHVTSSPSKPPADNPQEIALHITDLTVSYEGQHPALWDIDLKIPRGDLMAIVGPNGAGKSTLLRAMLDLIPKTSGEVFVFGSPYKKAKLSVGYVPQKNSIDWDFPITVYEVVLMGSYGRNHLLRPLPKSDKQKALDCLELMKIPSLKNRQINELSGGQQQRTFLARALMQDTSIILMDEPFAGVDIETEKTIANLFKTMQQQGKTLVVVHHNLNTLEEYFDSVTLLNKQIIASGALAEVFTKEALEKTYSGSMGDVYPLPSR